MLKKNITIFLLLCVLCFQILNANYTNRESKNFIFRDNCNTQENFRNEEELLEFIESIIQTHMIPGLSIAIVKNNSIVWENYFGYSNLNENILVDEDSMFILSSISKTITATALLQLYEDGLMNLDDSINDYLPFNVYNPNYPLSTITFKMLLSHVSSIKDNWSVMPYYNGDSDLELGYYLEQYLTTGGLFFDNSSNFTNSIPGSEFNYSNIGAALIGFLVEEISNQPFDEFCVENIFEPLNMDNTFWFLSEIDSIDSVAIPYQYQAGIGDSCFEIGCGIYDEGNECFCDFACTDFGDCCLDYEDVCGENGSGSNLDNYLEYSNYGYSDYPSGQLRTTSKSLAKFMMTFMNDGIYQNNQILSTDTIDLIKSIYYPEINSNQGLMWYYKNQDGRTLFGHNGGDQGSLTEMFISFSNDIGIVLLSNSTNYDAIIRIENALLNFAAENNFSFIGDLNNDLILNILDVIQLVNLVLNNQYDLIGDLNSDEFMNILDIIELINIIIAL